MLKSRRRNVLQLHPAPHGGKQRMKVNGKQFRTIWIWEDNPEMVEIIESALSWKSGRTDELTESFTPGLISLRNPVTLHEIGHSK